MRYWRNWRTTWTMTLTWEASARDGWRSYGFSAFFRGAGRQELTRRGVQDAEDSAASGE